MNEVVFDAAAMLALIQQERGQEKLTDEFLDHAVASAVNMAEVQSKLVRKTADADGSWVAALSTVSAVKPFTLDQARIAGDLITKTEKYGLSLGDRSCLALAIALNAPVYTTEEVWRDLDLGIPIHVIR